jgi:hypothetical protein
MIDLGNFFVCALAFTVGAAIVFGSCRSSVFGSCRSSVSRTRLSRQAGHDITIAEITCVHVSCALDNSGTLMDVVRRVRCDSQCVPMLFFSCVLALQGPCMQGL